MASSDARYQAYKEGGKKIATIREQLAVFAQTHFKLEDIESHAVQLIKEAGGEPAFTQVPNYHWATCISVNDAFVHGIPKGYLKPGDMVTIDTGMIYRGYTTDTATTIVIGTPTRQQQKFLDVGQKVLKDAIAAARMGNRVYHISKALQDGTQVAGYNVTRDLTGHGLGKTMHEDPAIPCFISNDPGLNIPLQEGMVLAIEQMYMQGNWPLKLDADKWTLRTADGSLSAVFEEDIWVGKNGPELLTNPS